MKISSVVSTRPYPRTLKSKLVTRILIRSEPMSSKVIHSLIHHLSGQRPLQAVRLLQREREERETDDKFNS